MMLSIDVSEDAGMAVQPLAYGTAMWSAMVMVLIESVSVSSEIEVMWTVAAKLAFPTIVVGSD